MCERKRRRLLCAFSTMTEVLFLLLPSAHCRRTKSLVIVLASLRLYSVNSFVFYSYHVMPFQHALLQVHLRRLNGETCGNMKLSRSGMGDRTLMNSLTTRVHYANCDCAQYRETYREIYRKAHRSSIK